MNSLRNEGVDTSPRRILSQIDLDSRTRKAEKDHLGRYQERLIKLGEQEARLEEVKSEIQRLSMDEKQNRKALAELRAEERNLNTSIKGLNTTTVPVNTG